MTRICILSMFPLLMTGLCISDAFAHKEHVHQYIVREAYRVFRSQLGYDVPIMGERLGSSEEGQGPFNPGGLIVIGAFREDRDDVVWGYGLKSLGERARETAAVTHLWDPDNGDGARFGTHWCFLPYLLTYPNAYEKAMKFVYGGWELQVHYPGTGITEAYEAPSYLPEYYKTGRIFYKGYYEINGQFVTRNYWTTSPQWFRDKVVWEILGRIAHLLGDVGVPAHAHFDQHDPVCGGNDTYEDQMATQYV